MDIVLIYNGIAILLYVYFVILSKIDGWKSFLIFI